MSNEKREFKVLEVEGIAMYPHVHKPVSNKYKPSDPPTYKLDLIVEKDVEKLLKAEGLTPTKKEVKDLENDTVSKIPKEYPGFEGKKVFTFYRKTVKKDGSPNSALPVVDSQNHEIPANILIGNGSRIVVSINPWTMQGKEGLVHGSNLLAVQVLELVPYTAAEQKLSFKPRDGGFAVGEVKESATDLGEGEIEF